MADAEPVLAVPAPAPAAPSIRSANLLVLISMLLVLTLGSLVQVWRMWPGLLLTELFLILLPALWFARSAGVPAAALRLKWAGARACWMGLVIGAGLFPAAAGAGWITEKILGSYSLPDSFWPKGAGVLVYLLASVVSAPFCEEMLFRGYVLSAYERSGLRPRTAIVMVAALFTVYHVSLWRAAGVGLLALALTYAAWRTGSIWPSMAAHVGANGAAAVLVLTRGAHDTPQLFWTAVPGAAAAAWCLWRIGGNPREAAGSVPVSRGARQWWPAFAAGAIFLLAAGGEILIYRSPERRYRHEVRIEAPWRKAVAWVYEIHGEGGHIGDAEYRLTPERGRVVLEGSVRWRAGELVGGGVSEFSFTAAWERNSLSLSRFHGCVSCEGQPDAFQFTGHPAPPGPGLSGGLFSPYELPWRLSAAVMLQTRAGEGALLTFREAAMKPGGGESRRSFVIQVDPAVEAIRTRAGTFRTVRLAMGGEMSAWYDVEAPHAVIRYRSEGREWVLARVVSR